MIDVALFYIALFVWTVTLNPLAVARIRPRPFDRDDVEGTLAGVQADYERKSALRLLLTLSTLLGLVYFALRAFYFPARGWIPDSTVRQTIAAILFGYILSALGSVWVRDHWERRFASENPTFREIVSPLAYRLWPVGILGAPLFGIALSLLDGSETGLVYIVIGILGEFVCIRQYARARGQIGRRLDPESPLAQRVQSVVESFGKPPKVVAVIPSATANGFALPDGSVLLTSALVAVASIDEVAALVAHEMSHVRDGDAKRLRLAWLALWILACLLMSGAILLLNFRRATGPYVVPIALLILGTVMAFGRSAVARIAQPREFKCDADAAALGLAHPMASVLRKLYALNRAPRCLLGLDRSLSLHPSLDDRLAALSR